MFSFHGNVMFHFGNIHFYFLYFQPFHHLEDTHAMHSFNIVSIIDIDIMVLDIPLRKTNARQKSLSFLGQKIWSKIKPTIKNVTPTASFFSFFF